MSVNKVILVGRLGRDPEGRTTGSGGRVVKLSLATDARSKGESKTDWHTVACFDRTADACEKYLKKGAQVYVEGRISYNRYEKDGETKYFTEILANEVRFLDSGNRGGGNGGAGSNDKPLEAEREVPINTDDSPF